jgi:P-type E1-E2 ATPase
MTGNGVNGAPALKAADIDLAMCSETKDAAKMILEDDSFSSIVEAVGDGRAICNNTTAFIRSLLICNIREVISCFVSSIIGGPNLLTSTRLLFVNLVNDGLPARPSASTRQNRDLRNYRPGRSRKAAHSH